MSKSPKIRVVQIAYGTLAGKHSWFSKYVEPINRVYCALHGYDYHVGRWPELPGNRHNNWEKVNFVKRHLRGTDWVFYLDADALFYSHVILLSDILKDWSSGGHCMLFPADHACETNRWFSDLPNTGAWFAKNTPETHAILEEWDDMTEDPRYIQYRDMWPIDQKGLQDVIYPKYKERIKVIPDYYLLGATYGQFIRHLMLGGTYRAEMFREIYESKTMVLNRLLWREIGVECTDGSASDRELVGGVDEVSADTQSFPLDADAGTQIPCDQPTVQHLWSEGSHEAGDQSGQRDDQDPRHHWGGRSCGI